MSRNGLSLFAVMSAFLLSCGIATAHTFCVDNETDLQGALTSASTNGTYANEDNVIQIVVGAYGTGAATSQLPFTYISTAQHSLTILGGFNTGCTARTPNATATLIDGQNHTGAMVLYNLYGDIAVSDLTFQHGNADSDGAGLSINYCLGICALPQGESVSVMHSVIRDNTASNHDCGGLFINADTLAYVAHSLIADNSSGTITGGGACIHSNASQFYGNTVVSNNAASASGAIGGLDCGGTCEIDDNIFWDNSGYGLGLENTGAILLFNDFGARTGATPSIEIGDVSENPRFVDLAGGNFHLASGSPLIGLSNVVLNGDDLQGNPYPPGGFQDLGAFEETIFEDGFEP